LNIGISGQSNIGNWPIIGENIFENIGIGFKIMILKPTPEMSEQAHRPGNGSLILNRQSSKQSH